MSFWEQVKEKTETVPTKLKMIFLENHIESQFLRLGSRTYDLSKASGILADDREVNLLLADIKAKKDELAALKEDFRKFWKEEVRELKTNLETSGGAVEQVEIRAAFPAKGKRIKELELPKEVLIGAILRGGILVVPDGETEIQEGDRVTLMGTKKDVKAAKKYLEGE